MMLLLTEEIRKALKAMNLLKVLEGKEALGNISNTKDIGEHKVCLPPRLPSLSPVPS
jgi:glycylpeptide N-tetradecanoyltransferase